MNDIFPNSTHIKQLLHLADDTDIASFLEKIWDGETISIVVGIKADEEEALKQGLRELSLLGESGKNAYSDSAEKCSNVSENFLIVGAINRSRYGKFPFFRDEVPAPTPMDDLALDAGVLDFVSKAFTSYKDEDGILSDSSHKKHTTASHPVYPKLVDARLVNLFDKESSHTIEIEYRDYWNLISTSSKTGNASRQLILVTIPLSFTDRIKSSNINVTFFDPSKTVQVQTHQNHQSIKPALKILFRHPDTQYLESGDMAIIRYLEHAQPWIASLNLMQRSAIGFPPPWHSYWQDVNSFKQVERRFRNCGMDFGPYRIDQAVTKVHTPLQPIPQHPHMSKEYHPDKTYLEPCRLVDPEQVSLLDGIPSLTDDQIRQFRDDGYLFLDGIFPSEVIDSAVDAAEMLWPDEGHLGDRKLSIRDFSFPFRDNRLNTLTTHDNLLTVIKQLLGVEMTNDIRIMQSICVPKRGTSVDTKVIEDCDNTCEPMTPGNQKMHWDFGNNTLLVPSRTPSNWSQVEEIQGILYYNEFDGVEGSTNFVPGLRHTDYDPIHNGWLQLLNPNEKDPRPDLYKLERGTRYKKGSILLLQLGTWHRGTPVLKGKIRRVHHLCFRRADCQWLGTCEGFGQPTASSLSSWAGISKLEPNQRKLLGL